MMHEQMLLARNAYSYPTVGLDANQDQKEFDSVVELEKYHYELLRSRQDNEVLNGYLSVLYWGFVSGQTGGDNSPRAKGLVNKAKRKLAETDAPDTFVADVVRVATELIDSRRQGIAVLLLTHLPQMQFSFASKVAAFLNPAVCGISDSKIAAGLPELGFEAAGSSVKAKPGVSVVYNRYCAFLEEIADQINHLGSEFRWTDKDSVRHCWRAIDVERAIFKALDGGFPSLVADISASIRARS